MFRIHGRGKVPKRVENRLLNIEGGGPRDRSCEVVLSFRDRSRDVVAIADPALYREARSHPMATVVVESPDEQSFRSRLE